jgi:hypothetical protein
MTENLLENLLAETEIDDQTLSQLVRLPTWTARQAQQVLQAQAKSGKSIVRFAARYRFSPSRLYNWRRRLEAPGSGAPLEPLPAPFVPVCISAPPTTQSPAPLDPADRPDPPCGLRVRMPSGTLVRVYNEAPESLVRCVLLALKESAC